MIETKRSPFARAPPDGNCKSVAVPSASAAAIFAAAAATAGRTLFARLGLIHGQITPIQSMAVQGRNRLFRLLGRTHGHEGKASRTTAGAVHHEIGFQDGAVS